MAPEAYRRLAADRDYLQAALALYPNATWVVTHLGFSGTDTSKLEEAIKKTGIDRTNRSVTMEEFYTVN